MSEGGANLEGQRRGISVFRVRLEDGPSRANDAHAEQAEQDCRYLGTLERGVEDRIDDDGNGPDHAEVDEAAVRLVPGNPVSPVGPPHPAEPTQEHEEPQREADDPGAWNTSSGEL